MLTVYIGRFSPFHNGHADVLRRALSSFKTRHVLVLIGSADASRSIKNPFTFEERKAMIMAWYNRELQMDDNLAQLIIEPLNDHPYNDSKWIAEVQQIVDNHRYDDFTTKPKLTGANRDNSTWYLSTFGNYFELDLVSKLKHDFSLNATTVRELLFNEKLETIKEMVPFSTFAHLNIFLVSEAYSILRNEYEFVKGYKEAWGNSPYPPTFVTVDATIIQSGHVLVITRAGPLGGGLLALPGGFIEQDETLLQAVIRELKEETDIEMSVAQLKGSIVASEVFDNPGRSTRGRTITHNYLFKLDDTKPLPKVKPQPGEVQKLEWVPIAEALHDPTKWYEDHYHMLTSMIDKL